jgi:hypothetical protein
MEKHFPQALIAAIDEQQRNLNQCLYERYEMKPERNSLKFNNSYDESITSEQIIKKINFLKTISIKFFDGIYCEIKVTEHTWYFKYDGVLHDTIIKILLDDPTLAYLEISNVIYINNLMIEQIDKNIIKYNPKSFRQGDNNIKLKIYEILTQEIKSKNLYLIGGEMVFFAKLLKPENFIAYTDFESIYQDAIENFSENKDNIRLINYDLEHIVNFDTNIVNNYHLIANTSKHGLGNNLCKEILNLGLNNTIISCNKKSFNRDFLILKSKYNITKIFDLNTNYVVTIYFLTKIKVNQ